MCSQSVGKILFLCIAVTGANRAAAQTASLTLSGGSGGPGANVTLEVSLTTNGALPAAIQWDLLYSASHLSPAAGTFFSTGAAATLAGKQATCNLVATGDIRCLVAGLNDSAIGNGVLSTVTFQIAAGTTDTSTQVMFSNLDASDGSSTPKTVPITGTGAAVTIFQSHGGGPQPTLMPGSVRSAANGGLPNPPGSLVYVQGTSMAGVTPKALISSSTPFSAQLQDNLDTVSVTVNGKAAPMYYALPTIVAFQLPWETDVSTGTATLVVTRNKAASAPLQFPVGKFSPGIYTTSGTGTGMAWAIFAVPSKINPRGQVAQAGNVAKYLGAAATAGDVLYMYAGGLGPPKNAQKMVDGQAPCPLLNNVPGACPADYKPSDYATNTTPEVLVGGVPATGITSILDPTYPGLYLVYFTVPAGAPKGNAVPIRLQIGGVSTDAANVTIAIQ